MQNEPYLRQSAAANKHFPRASLFHRIGAEVIYNPRRPKFYERRYVGMRAIILRLAWLGDGDYLIEFPADIALHVQACDIEPIG